jgi:hypothetical protein
MNNMIRKLQQMTAEEVNWLVAVLLATMLGSLISGSFLEWGMAQTDGFGVLGQLLVSLAATLIYGGIIGGTFYLLFPKSRLAFKKIWMRRR